MGQQTPQPIPISFARAHLLSAAPDHEERELLYEMATTSGFYGRPRPALSEALSNTASANGFYCGYTPSRYTNGDIYLNVTCESFLFLTT